MSQIKTKFIKDLAITTAKINLAAVTEEKIGSAAVSEGKIASAAVSESKLASDSVSKAKIQSDAVDSSKVRLTNDAALRARNAADSADVELLKFDGSNVLQFVQMPRLPSDPSNDSDAVRRSYLFDTGADTIKAARLPSYVDDVLEYDDLASFPVSGEGGKIYLAKDTNKCYRWSGSVYILITSGAVDSVNGETGVVVLDTDDIDEGLSNLYFTAERAQTAAVENTIGSSETIKAPSQKAVYDALALKLDKAGGTMTGDLNMSADVIPSVDQTQQVGKLGKRFLAGYFNTVDATLVQMDNIGLFLQGTSKPTGGSIAAVNFSQNGAIITKGVSDASADATASPSLFIETGNKSAGTGNSGSINISTGSSAGGSRGKVSVSASALSPSSDNAVPLGENSLRWSSLNVAAITNGALGAPVFSNGASMNSAKITSLANGTSSSDAVNLSQLDGVTLDLQTEINALRRQEMYAAGSLGYIDLDFEAASNSIVAFADRLALREGYDFTTSVVSGKTRMTWIGDVAVGGLEELSPTDDIFVTYQKKIIIS